MKKLTLKKSLILVTLSSALVACEQDKQQENTAATAEKGEVVKVEMTAEQTSSYSIGQNFAAQLKANGEDLAQYGVKIDSEYVVKGLQESLADRAQFSQEELQTNLQAFQANIQEKMKQAQEKAAAEAKVKAVATIAAGDAFRAEYAKKEGVKSTESGLLYSVLETGKGEVHPLATDNVQVHYKGTLIDGTEFDSSHSRGAPSEFFLNRVIKGWTEGVQLMKVGDKYEFVIAPEMAYGERDSGKIPASSTLVFEVELIAINPEDEVKPAEEVK